MPESYEEDLAIDPHALDEEIIRHPAIYMRYAAMLSQAQKEQDEAKSDMDLVKADLDTRIRQEPESFGLKKATESAIQAAITTHETFRRAESHYFDVTSTVRLLAQVVRAFEHRKKALELQTQLYIAGYWAGPKEPRNLEPGKRYADRRAGEATAKNREKLNRRRKK